jgi:hypothetical protein
LAGVALGQWLQRKHLTDAATERRRDEAAAILAPVKALVLNSHPLTLGLFNPQQHLQETMPLLIEEWKSSGVALLKLSLSHPSAQVRELAEQTQEALSRSIASARMFLDDLSRRISTQEVKTKR